MMKSVTVAVTRMFRHARLDKTVRETKKYMVRRENNTADALHLRVAMPRATGNLKPLLWGALWHCRPTTS